MKRTALTETAVRQLAAYGLSADALTNCAVQNYHVGEYIMRQGVENSNFFIVLSGISKVCVDAPNGKNLILCYYVTQGVMGDVELMLDRFIATTSVIAVSDFSCIAIPFFESAAISPSLMRSGKPSRRSSCGAVKNTWPPLCSRAKRGSVRFFRWRSATASFASRCPTRRSPLP